MTREDLIEGAARRTGLTKAQVAQVVSSVLTDIQSAFKSGEKVTIHGFGTFTVNETPARTGRNPRTKEEVEIPAGKRVVFKASKVIRDELKGYPCL